MSRTQDSYAVRFVLSGLSAATSESVTFPLDFLKTRLQLQGELVASSADNRGLLSIARHILRTEGPLGLYAGWSAAVARHIPYTGIRVMIFEQLRCTARSRFLSPQAIQDGVALPLPVNLLLGLTAGALGQAAAVPADLVKVRLQADGRLVAAGVQAAPRYKGLGDAFRAIAQQEGVGGLWRGSVPAIQRAALVNLGELTTYDQAKRAVVRSGVTGGDNVYTHVLSSLCSGFCASLISTPADVVKTRMMNQDPGRPLYTGMVDCFMKTLRAEGWGGLYKGFFPTWARLGPWQLTFWVTYEELRKLGGLGTF